MITGLFGTASARSMTPSQPAVSGADNFGTSASSSPSDTSVAQQFLKLAKMDPMARMRASILKSMNSSEDDLAKMSPAQRDAVEQKIAQMIQQQMEKNGGKPGSSIDFSA